MGVALWSCGDVGWKLASRQAGAGVVSGCRLFSVEKMGCLMRAFGLLNDIVAEHGVLVGERSRLVVERTWAS